MHSLVFPFAESLIDTGKRIVAALQTHRISSQYACHSRRYRDNHLQDPFIELGELAASSVNIKIRVWVR